jgi:hypothetical protein
MIPPDLDVEERQAVALPQDFPQDYYERVANNVCGDCLRVFVGKPSRIQCRLCAGRRTL